MKIQFIDIKKLLLDSDNDRFAELYDGSKKEDDLIEYLLYTESAQEVAKNISARNQFYPDEALWVIPIGENFLVKDGNRRCAAVKALQIPRKYSLDLPKMNIKDLPALVYTDDNELSRRIQEQHTHSLFREWERIAKALKAFEMYNSGSSEDSIREIDSNPSSLIKLASFYYEAVKVAGEDLKKLLRRGKGGMGGKTIIFERLFSYSKLCGYRFKGKPSYQIDLLDKDQFARFINAIVSFLKDHPLTTHKNVDEEQGNFLNGLKDYDFLPTKANKKNTGSIDINPNTVKSQPPIIKRGSIKTRPAYERKQVAPKLKRLIDECYNLDNISFSNAKVALARVVFESVLKYVVDETDHNGKKLKNYNYFRHAFYDKNNKHRKYTDFTVLKTKFIELIIDTGSKKAFEQFDLEKLHQIIHNYKTCAGPNDARTVGENLIPLVEFMLQESNDLLASLDTKKLV